MTSGARNTARTRGKERGEPLSYEQTTFLKSAISSKSFGTHEVLRDIDFNVKKGDVISIIGASGSGKSTLLRCINLLETPSERRDPLPRQKRRGHEASTPPKYRSHVGMVFQSFNLFNNMTVLEKLHGRPDEGPRSRSKEEAREQAMTLS